MPSGDPARDAEIQKIKRTILEHREADAKIKEEVARLRGKDEYELGDLSLALDQIAKEEVCKLTGKDDYEVQLVHVHMNT